MKIIIPEIEDIVNFYKPEVIEEIAKKLDSFKENPSLAA